MAGGKKLAVSPLAPTSFPHLPSLAGVEIEVAHSGIRYKGRSDLLLISFPKGSSVAGVFTRSATRSAPVDWCRNSLSQGNIRAAVINAGNANAFTGSVGMAVVEATAAAAAKRFSCKPEEVFIASTGVIGQKLAPNAIADAFALLKKPDNGWAEAAKAIMTTDTFPKLATVTTNIAGTVVTINGIAKGSGMIAPDMATMIALVATDAAIPSPLLQELLRKGVAQSFNAITVDGDTSTSDSLLVIATGGAANVIPETINDPILRHFKKALNQLLLELAQQVVKDGEGATKFITVRVKNAVSSRSAHKIALAIGNSPLVKTAIAGEDANWGRVVMAVGKSGEPADRDRLSVAMGGVVIASHGSAVENYDETPVVAHMKGQDIVIEVDIGLGRGKAEIYSCDLTHAYIDINGSYRS
ncbi:MAG: bifunctional glutamate N-acetyltransferase/amino-acid acetyltransferase ArgJ [Alphaproteobacteria bacterium]